MKSTNETVVWCEGKKIIIETTIQGYEHLSEGEKLKYQPAYFILFSSEVPEGLSKEGELDYRRAKDAMFEAMVRALYVVDDLKLIK